MSEPTSRSASSAHLLIAAVVRFLLSAVVLAILIFGTAGSFEYWNGWLFMAALFIPMTFTLLYLHKRDPSLLEKRMKVQEKEKVQKAYVKWSLFWFAISFALPGLDFRLGWSRVPDWLVLVSVVVMIIGYALFIVTMMQNSFASRVIEIQADQRLIDTGLYAVVRHPLYMAATIMYTACPLVLGSYYALIPTLCLPLLLVYRIRNEESVLRSGLAGYEEYTHRVKYRLIPFVW